jgi:hypothetical protein
MSHLKLLACLALLISWPRPAHADAQRSEAEHLFEQARACLAEGEFERAVNLFERSFTLSSEPLLVYDIAHAYWLKGDCDSALRQYRRYLQLTREPPPGTTSDEPRRLALQRSIDLERQCGQPLASRPAPTTTAAPEPVKAVQPPEIQIPQKRASRVSALPLVLAGIGGAALSVGIYYLAVDGREQCTSGEAPPCAFRRDTGSLGRGLLLGGGALFASAVTLAVWEIHTKATMAAAVGVGSLRLGGMF